MHAAQQVPVGQHGSSSPVQGLPSTHDRVAGGTVLRAPVAGMNWNVAGGVSPHTSGKAFASALGSRMSSSSAVGGCAGRRLGVAKW